MKAMEARFRVIDLQKDYCKNCVFNNYPSQYCKEHCEIGKEIIRLGKRVNVNQSIYKKSSKEKWDEKCQQAVVLYEQGMDYPHIAKELRCHVSNLYKELTQRELLKFHHN